MDDRLVGISVSGIGDWIEIDYGDGSPPELLPFPTCSGWLTPFFVPLHVWPSAGTYTVTVRVRGSEVCETNPASYLVSRWRPSSSRWL